MTTQQILSLSLYALLGPGLWLFFALGLITARARMNRLRDSKAKLPTPAPAVTVLIPAHNEGPGIEQCLRTVLALDYPDLRVLAIDDRSTDQTPEVMDRIAAEDSRLSVLRVTHKPLDWLGKCHALHLGSRQVTTPWILFVDSDVTVTPDSLRAVLAQAVSRSADAVSILTRQRCDTFWERLLTPVACGAVLAMYVASLTNDDNRPSIAFANGQFFLVRREAYLKAGGHETVKNMPTEDVDLMRALKRSGAKCRLYAGDHLAETRMYDSLARMFKGWARIYSGASHRKPWRILIGSVFALSGIAAFPAAILARTLHASPWLTALVVLHLVTLLASIATVYRWSGNRSWYALLFPLAGIMQLGFYAYALWWCITNKMEWRGSAYSAPPSPTPGTPR